MSETTPLEAELRKWAANLDAPEHFRLQLVSVHSQAGGKEMSHATMDLVPSRGAEPGVRSLDIHLTCAVTPEDNKALIDWCKDFVFKPKAVPEPPKDKLWQKV